MILHQLPQEKETFTGGSLNRNHHQAGFSHDIVARIQQRVHQPPPTGLVPTLSPDALRMCTHSHLRTQPSSPAWRCIFVLFSRTTCHTYPLWDYGARPWVCAACAQFLPFSFFFLFFSFWLRVTIARFLIRNHDKYKKKCNKFVKVSPISKSSKSM